MSERTVLLTVRLAGVAELEAVATRLGSDDRSVATVLDQLASAGMVVRRSSPSLSGWSLTAAGRARGEQLLAVELDRERARAGMERAHAHFVELNPRVLQVCSDWQVVDGAAGLMLNAHEDASYDEEVLGRLAALHAQARTMLATAEASLGRFAPYRARLDNALARALAGGLDWVTRPLIDSYHTVWFELHEDLLATLGRRRTDERDNGTSADGPQRDEERR